MWAHGFGSGEGWLELARGWCEERVCTRVDVCLELDIFVKGIGSGL